MINAVQLANTYLFSPDEGLHPHIYREFIVWSKKLYRETVQEYGLRVSLVSGQPYSGLSDLLKDFKSRHIRVSTDNNQSVRPPQTNLQFRAVHDVHHCLCNADFSLQGELAVWRFTASPTNNDLFKQILFSEIVLQAAVKCLTGHYPAQKVVLVPLERLVQYA